MSCFWFHITQLSCWIVRITLVLDISRLHKYQSWTKENTNVFLFKCLGSLGLMIFECSVAFLGTVQMLQRGQRRHLFDTTPDQWRQSEWPRRSWLRHGFRDWDHRNNVRRSRSAGLLSFLGCLNGCLNEMGKNNEKHGKSKSQSLLFSAVPRFAETPALNSLNVFWFYMPCMAATFDFLSQIMALCESGELAKNVSLNNQIFRWFTTLRKWVRLVHWIQKWTAPAYHCLPYL